MRGFDQMTASDRARSTEQFSETTQKIVLVNHKVDNCGHERYPKPNPIP